MKSRSTIKTILALAAVFLFLLDLLDVLADACCEGDLPGHVRAWWEVVTGQVEVG